VLLDLDAQIMTSELYDTLPIWGPAFLCVGLFLKQTLFMASCYTNQQLHTYILSSQQPQRTVWTTPPLENDPLAHSQITQFGCGQVRTYLDPTQAPEIAQNQTYT